MVTVDQSEIYFGKIKAFHVFCRHNASTGAYDWDEVIPRHTAALSASEDVITTAQSTCGLSMWLPPVNSTTDTCPDKEGPRYKCAYGKCL